MKKVIIDERQKLEMYTIEHYGFWAFYLGMTAIIVYRLLFAGASLSDMAPEFILFMVIGLVSGYFYYKTGNWGYFTSPNPKTYFGISLLSSILLATIMTASTYNGGRAEGRGLLAIFLVYFVIQFVMFIVLISFIGMATVKKRKQREKELGLDEDENKDVK